MLDAMLDAHGVRSGMFTSPHLVRPNERIRLAGVDIDDAELDRQLEKMRGRIEHGMANGELQVHPSFFEVMTATALQSFADHELRAAVLEVGLGGRLDATNAVEPDVCTIVSLALDHTKTLGATLEKIAFEKAGIVKPGRPLVSGVVQQRGIDVLARICRARRAEMIDARLAVQLVADDGDVFALRSAHARYDDLRLSLPGRHQIDNARVALAAFELLAARMGLRPEPVEVREALAAIRWPGRLQWIEDENGGPPLLLDAAHNPAGLLTLVDHLRAKPLPRPAVLLFGAVSGKPLDRLLGSLSELGDAVVLTRPPVERGVDAEEIAPIARPLFERVEIEPDPGRALDRARAIAGREGSVLVTGSLYLVGTIAGLLTRRSVPGPVGM